MLCSLCLALCAPLAPPCSRFLDAKTTLQDHMPQLMHSLLLSFVHLLSSEAPFNITAAVIL